MIYYFIIFLLFVFALIAQLPLKKDHQNIFKYVIILLISIVGSLRYKVGYDWFSYETLYDGFYSITDVFESREEKFFTLFLYISKLVINNFSFFVFVLFLVTFFLKLLVIEKLSSDIFFSLFIYIATVFLIYDLNGIRQGMAMSLTFISTIFVYKRQLFYFLFAVGIAALFHTSAIIFLPFYWLSEIKLPKKKILSFFMILFVIVSIPIKEYILNNPLFQYLFSFESLVHYGSYVDEGSEINKSISVLSIATFQRLFIWSMFVYNFEKIKCSEKLKNILLNGYTLSVILFVLFSFSAEFSARLSYYYKILEIIIIPLIISSQIKRFNRILFLFAFSILLIIGLVRLLSAEDNGLLPYNILPFFQ